MEKPMKPSEMCKAIGLPSLKYVEHMTGKHYKTLINWHEHEHELFKIVILGCKARQLIDELSHLK